MTGWFTYSQNTNRTIFPLQHLNFACINHVPSSGACGLLGCLLQRIILHTGLWLTECPSLKAAILNWASVLNATLAQGHSKSYTQFPMMPILNLTTNTTGPTVRLSTFCARQDREVNLLFPNIMDHMLNFTLPCSKIPKFPVSHMWAFKICINLLWPFHAPVSSIIPPLCLDLKGTVIIYWELY